jgi:hypothetical protein
MGVFPILQQVALTSLFKAFVLCSGNVDFIVVYLPTFHILCYFKFVCDLLYLAIYVALPC